MKIKRKKYSGKIRNASKIIYDNIEFKSKLELYCYSKLKENSILSEYEKHTFELIPSFKSTTSFEPGKEKGISIIKEKNNSIRRMTYTPDFVNIKDKWIIECKGYPNDQFPIKWKLFKYFLHINHMNFTLFLPRNQNHINEIIKIIKNNEQSTRLLFN